MPRARARLGLSDTRVGSALGGLAGSVPTTMRGLVDALGGTGRGGGTKAAAQKLGVDPRTVQRYLREEEGKGGQTRGKKVLKERVEQLRGAVKSERTRDIIKQYGGVHVHWEGDMEVSEDISERELDQWIPADELEPMLDEWEAGNGNGAAAELQVAFLNRYDENGAGGLPRDSEGNVAAFLVRTSSFSVDL